MSCEEKKNRKLIMIPYAELEGAKSGQNVSPKDDKKAIYLKNCCVACISAKKHNDCDVALVTNIEVSEPYKSLLDNNGVLIVNCEFDSFCFDKEYTWCLAFYKLCALRYAVNSLEYDYYAYTDADVYFQASIDHLWRECDDHIMLYDINHGLQVDNYRKFLDEIATFLGKNKCVVHYGGEFFAASKQDSIDFSDKCYEIYLRMLDEGISTTRGDEFIISLAADAMQSRVKNAGAYIHRFWTGVSFRLISTCYKYNAVSILHVPSEKECGVIRVYDKYISKDKIPPKGNLYRMLQLSGKDWVGAVKRKIGKIFKKTRI